MEARAEAEAPQVPEAEQVVEACGAPAALQLQTRKTPEPAHSFQYVIVQALVTALAQVQVQQSGEPVACSLVC